MYIIIFQNERSNPTAWFMIIPKSKETEEFLLRIYTMKCLQLLVLLLVMKNFRHEWYPISFCEEITSTNVYSAFCHVKVMAGMLTVIKLHKISIEAAFSALPTRGTETKARASRYLKVLNSHHSPLQVFCSRIIFRKHVSGDDIVLYIASRQKS